MSKIDELQEIWEEHGFPSATRFWKILQQQGLSSRFNKVDVEKYIDGQNVTQLHRRPVRTKHSHITTTDRGIMYCIDLLDMSAYSHDNGGVKWLLLCIDIFSRRAAIIGVKNKTAGLVADALEKAMKDLGMVPKVVLSDQGSEFKGATSKFLAKHGVIHRLADVGDHRRLGIVDRFSGVVKSWIARHMTYHQTKKYMSVLPKLVEKYNSAPHSSLGGMSPNEAWEFPREARNFHYERIQRESSKKRRVKGDIAVGDWVRVLKLKGVFDKGYHIRYSLVPHQVVEIKGLNYILGNERFYRAARLQKVTPPGGEEEAPPQDVAQQARRSHRVAVKLKTEGIERENVRRSNRERRPTDLVKDDKYGRVNWS